MLLIQDVIVKSGDIFTDEDTIPRSYTKLTEILQSLVDRFSKCDLEAFNLVIASLFFFFFQIAVIFIHKRGEIAIN